ncbi:PLDc N-terminal domain-containing protein [Lactococcus garvieae]|nr:PLDc N-terminal domain-containing protein [Lactococcus garvieae]
MPKWAWALVCIISIPLGGILYFIVGRDTYE